MGEDKNHIDKIISNLQAEEITLPRSDKATDLIEEKAGGRIKIFGQKDKDPTRSARRTEIITDSGLVLVHKDTGVARGLYSLASRYSKVVVKKENSETSTLNVRVDPDTSPSNPVYFFEEMSSEQKPIKIGYGHGHNIDLIIAEELLGTRLAYTGEYLEPAVLNWIKSKLQD